MAVLHPVILPVPIRHRQWAGPSTAAALSAVARDALSRSAGLSKAVLGTLQKDDAGAPLPANGWHWSISHKRTYAGGVVSRQPIGFDIERPREVHPGLWDRTATMAEWELVARNIENLFRFWTAKEAVMKAAGTGLRDLSNCRIERVTGTDTMAVSLHGKQYTVVHFRFDEHVAAVAAIETLIIQWHLETTSS